MHALLGLGRDLPRFHGCPHASRLLAGTNRRAQPHLAQDGNRRHPPGSGVEEDGEYATQPRAALQIAADFLIIAGSAPLLMQANLATREAADQYLADSRQRITTSLDANDFLYALTSSRNYDPSSQLGSITAR